MNLRDLQGVGKWVQGRGKQGGERKVVGWLKRCCVGSVGGLYWHPGTSAGVGHRRSPHLEQRPECVDGLVVDGEGGGDAVRVAGGLHVADLGLALQGRKTGRQAVRPVSRWVERARSARKFNDIHVSRKPASAVR